MGDIPLRLRCLTLAYSFPYPPRSGYDLRVCNLARHLAPDIDQTLLCRSAAPVDAARMSECLRDFRDAHVLHIPRPGLPAKVFKVLRFLPGPYPIGAAGMHFASMRNRLGQLMESTAFDFVVLEGAWLCSYWPVICRSKALRILNATDVEASLQQRQAEMLKPGIERTRHLLATGRLAEAEKAIVRTADLVWTCSRRDCDYFREAVPGARVEVAPNGVDCDAIQPLPPSATKEILFVGYFRHRPNLDGVLYFAREVYPLLRAKVPDATLCIVGRGAPPEVVSLAGIPGITVAGEVPELEPYYRRCAASVVPLRAGGGTRLKILESMAFGRPVVSTTIGAEGLDVVHGRHLLIADDAAGIAGALARVIQHPDIAGSLAANARALVEEKYNWQAIASRMAAEYRDLIRLRSARNLV
jgi:polysaccharide biosynthesis protein PslH